MGASGNGKSVTRGIWGIGYVTGPVRDEVLLQFDEIEYWLDENARLAVTNSVDVDIRLFDYAFSEGELKAAGIDDLEVQVQRQGSNPSWISKDQLARLEVTATCMTGIR